MATPFSVQVLGKKEILKALRAIGDGAPALIEDSVRMGVRTFERELRRRAPVDEGVLKRNMRSGAKRKKGAVIGFAGPSSKGAHGSMAEYGYYNKRARKRVPARPWARPAFESKVAGVEIDILNRMQKDIETQARIAGKLSSPGSGGSSAIAL